MAGTHDAPDARASELPPEVAKHAMEGAVDAIVVVAPDGTIRWANEAVSLVGWTAEALVGQQILDLVAAEDLGRMVEGARAISQGFQLPSSAPFDVVGPDGTRIECDVASWTVGPRRAPDAVILHVRPTQDSRILRDLLHRLLAGESAHDVLVSMLDLLYHRSSWASPVVRYLDEVGTFRVVGPLDDPVLTGLDPRAGTPWTALDAVDADGVVTKVDDLPSAVAARARSAGFGACWVVPVRTDGELIAMVTIWAAADGPSVRVDPYSVGLLAQLVELVWRWRRQSIEREQAALRDPLTGLPNRRALDALEPSTDDDRSAVGVLYIDLDRFKPVNDSLGHAAGDEVLRSVARRLAACVRPTDLVARLGGDEFGVVVAGCTADELQAVGERVLASIAEPMDVRGVLIEVGSSVGAAHGTASVAALFEQADAALYRAKEGGRGQMVWA